MVKRQTIEWAKDIRGLVTLPGNIIAIGDKGKTELLVMEVINFYTETVYHESYGTEAFILHDPKDLIQINVPDTYVTTDSTNIAPVVYAPIFAVYGRIVRTDKSKNSTKTIHCSPYTIKNSNFGKFIRIAESLEEFLEYPVFS